jgi:CheY-like chemotaxis protein
MDTGDRYMTTDEGAGKSVTVLICDDEPRLATLTAGLLEEYGYRPLTVATGNDALAVVGTANPPIDVLLLDVSLPVGATAHDVLRELDLRKSPIRVILTSGFAAEDIPPAVRSHPIVAAYVAKPYKADDLVTTIRRAILES